jgi:putative ATP-dependent endonuclease of OLD family
VFIKRIQVQNFRNFRDLTIDDLTPNVVVVGENNVGKSNLLHALALLLDHSLPDMARTLRAEDFWDGLNEPFAGNTISISVDVAGYDTDERAVDALANCIVTYDPMVARLNYSYQPKGNIDPSNAGPDDYEYFFYGRDDPLISISEARRYISLRVLPALRDAESELQQWRRSPLRPLLQRLALPDGDLKQIAASLTKATQSILDQEAPLVLPWARRSAVRKS